jgi:hypothetical protein
MEPYPCQMRSAREPRSRGTLPPERQDGAGPAPLEVVCERKGGAEPTRNAPEPVKVGALKMVSRIQRQSDLHTIYPFLAPTVNIFPRAASFSAPRPAG